MSILVGLIAVLIVVLLVIAYLVSKWEEEKEFYSTDTKTKYTRINGSVILTEKIYDKGTNNEKPHKPKHQ